MHNPHPLLQLPSSFSGTATLALGKSDLMSSSFMDEVNSSTKKHRADISSSAVDI